MVALREGAKVSRDPQGAAPEYLERRGDLVMHAAMLADGPIYLFGDSFNFEGGSPFQKVWYVID